MTDTIEKVTLENAADQLKAKIRLAFVELLPEEQWKAMVMAELKRFTTETWQPRYPGSTDTIKVSSAFSTICSEVFGDYVKDQIKQLLRSPEWSEKWGNGMQGQASDAIKAWLTANSAALIQATVQAMAAQAAQHIVTSMGQLR